MTQTVQHYLSILRTRDYRRARRNAEFDLSRLTAFSCEDPRFTAEILAMMLEAETPHLFDEGDPFGFHRTVKEHPQWRKVLPEREFEDMFGNITPNYAAVIARGFDDIRDEVLARGAKCPGNHFYTAVLTCIGSILELSDRYAAAAEESGNKKLAAALARVPHKGATSYYEACLFFSILVFVLRSIDQKHMTLGRFDQYMLPYFEADRARGVSDEALLETTELFFIQLNFDTDLYSGVQQGDNGQSMVLGGFDIDGRDKYNDLSQMCMEASLALNVIDPKINLRCGKKTPQERLEFASKLTRQGLGFPQYCNDDVVVPGLIAWGYEPEDAYNYTVAACWEYIVPNCAADVPNRATMNFPLAVSNAVHAHLLSSESFEALLEAAKAEIRHFCDIEMAKYQKEDRILPAPLLSIFVDGCLELGRDVTEDVAKYNNYGCHGAGIANAADALAAIKIAVYEQSTVSKETLLAALDADFEVYTELRNLLLSLPKVGNDDDTADDLACILMDTFASYLNGKPNARGGIWRAGTGSAMEYIWSANVCPATADGRHAKAPYGSSYSPALTTRLAGPVSTITSMTKFDLSRIVNGGPLTMELHDSVFRDADAEKKVALLVRYFIDRGGHQLQLNAINRDVLLDAEEHPEKYPNLIVRVWGWSGYFAELDPVYRKHIIARTEFTV